MSEAGYPFFDLHARQHQRFFEYFDELRGEIESGEEDRSISSSASSVSFRLAGQPHRQRRSPFWAFPARSDVAGRRP
jgi:hypothetical protein